MVDLHTHSNKSDGSFSPAELVRYAAKKGLSAIALTDHDTTAGIKEAVLSAAGTGLEVIPGIEFSTEYEGKDIHLVGLYIDEDSPSFRGQIQSFVDSRAERNKKMCANLQGAGIDISYEKLRKEYPDSVITRAHYARFLLEYGYVRSMPEAFDRYLGDNTPYFVPREKVTPMQAVDLILGAGGFPVLAHPPLYHMSDARLDLLVSRLKDAGLMGIECLYSTYNAGEQKQMFRLADKYGLLPSGGSDFHGAAKPKLDLGCGYGNLEVPDSMLDAIRNSLLPM